MTLQLPLELQPSTEADRDMSQLMANHQTADPELDPALRAALLARKKKISNISAMY